MVVGGSWIPSKFHSSIREVVLGKILFSFLLFPPVCSPCINEDMCAWTVICYVSLWQCGGVWLLVATKSRLGEAAAATAMGKVWLFVQFCRALSFQLKGRSHFSNSRKFLPHFGDSLQKWFVRDVLEERKGFKWLSCLFGLFDSVKSTGERQKERERETRTITLQSPLVLRLSRTVVWWGME